MRAAVEYGDVMNDYWNVGTKYRQVKWKQILKPLHILAWSFAGGCSMGFGEFGGCAVVVPWEHLLCSYSLTTRKLALFGFKHVRNSCVSFVGSATVCTKENSNTRGDKAFVNSKENRPWSPTCYFPVGPLCVEVLGDDLSSQLNGMFKSTTVNSMLKEKDLQSNDIVCPFIFFVCEQGHCICSKLWSWGKWRISKLSS